MSSACGLNSHVRISTLLSVPQALSLHFIRILPSALTASFGAELCQHPLFGSLRTPKYAPTSQSALNCKKAARKSGFPFACARLLLFPTKCPRCAVVLCGDPDRRGYFRVLHPNIALRPSGTIRRIAVSSACGLNSHVRKSTLLSVPQALSLHFIRILPSALTASFGAELCQYPFFGSLRTTKYAPTSQSALNCKKAARKSGFPFACARLLLFPTKRARCVPHRKFFRRGPHTAPLCGGPDGGAFSRISSKWRRQAMNSAGGAG